MIVGCPPKIITPEPIGIRKPLNTLGTVAIPVKSDGTSDSTLQYSPYLVGSTSKGKQIRVIFSEDGEVFKLLKGDEYAHFLSYACPDIPSEWVGILFLYHNALTNQSGMAVDNPYKISVKITCYGEPRLIVDPNPVLMSTPVNTILPTKVVKMTNDGTEVLEITGFDYKEIKPLTGSKVTPLFPAASTANPLKIAVGGNNFFSLDPVCGNTAGKLEGTITISSNATNVPNGTLSVGVTLECTGAPQILATPNPLNLYAPNTFSGYADSIAGGIIKVENKGVGNLIIKNTTLVGNKFSMPNPIAPNTVIAPNDFQNVVIQGVCDKTTTVYSGTLKIESNDPSSPFTDVGLTLECFWQVNTGVEIRTFQRGGSFGSRQNLITGQSECYEEHNITIFASVYNGGVIINQPNDISWSSGEGQVNVLSVSGSIDCRAEFSAKWNAAKDGYYNLAKKIIVDKLKPYYRLKILNLPMDSFDYTLLPNYGATNQIELNCTTPNSVYYCGGKL